MSSQAIFFMTSSRRSRKADRRVAGVCRTFREGFTLVEMAVALSLLGVLLGYALPTTMRSISHGRVERGASRMSFLLQEARSAALANNQAVEIEVDTDTNVLTVWRDEDRDGDRDPGEVTSSELVDPNTVQVKTGWSSGAGFYNALGHFFTSDSTTVREITSHTCTFTSRDGNHKQTLTLRGSGSVIRQ